MTRPHSSVDYQDNSRTRRENRGHTIGMNYLEILGLSVIASDVLKVSIWEGRMLAHLAASAPGRLATYDFLIGLQGVPHHGACGPVSTRVSTKVARLRGALMDMGFSQSCIENVRGTGYRIAPDVAALVVAAILNPMEWGIAA